MAHYPRLPWRAQSDKGECRIAATPSSEFGFIAHRA
jgi:hypothetical protein